MTVGNRLDAGGGMVALRCPGCGELDDAHDCQPKKWDDPANAKHKQYDLKYVKKVAYGGGVMDVEERWQVTDSQARLMSSELKEQKDEPFVNDAERTHVPVLDIDFPCRLVPSTTPGHFHLILDGLELPWSKYEDLLVALAKAGVIEDGYAGAAIRRKASFVWKPGCKPPEADRSAPIPPPNPWIS